MKMVFGKKFKQSEKDKYDRLGRKAAQELLEALQFKFKIDAVNQAEMYSVYDFIAENASQETITFEVETRNGIDFIRNQYISPTGHIKHIPTVHTLFRKRYSQADYFIEYALPNPLENIEEAILIFNRYDIFEPDNLKESLQKQISETHAGTTQELYFNIKPFKGLLYVKRNGIWNKFYEKLKNITFHPLYQKWVIEKNEAYLPEIKKYEDIITNQNIPKIIDPPIDAPKKNAFQGGLF